MNNPKLISLCILFIFLYFFSIQDYFFKKISNFLILIGFLTFIFINLQIKKNYRVNLFDLFQNIVLISILLYIWIKGFIGGGDLKVIFLIMAYIPIKSSISFVSTQKSIFPDRIEFFMFLLFFLVITKLHKTEQSKGKEETKILIPLFFLSVILMVLF